jgi:hypothetical protein
MMKALTIWQPWASLIMIGAKPMEFRKWDYRERHAALVNSRILIHAAAREIKPAEIFDLIKRCEAEETSLIAERALPLLRKIFDARKCRGVVELSAALGTARLCAPQNVDRLFKAPDSDRIEHHMFGWPLKDIRAFVEPIPMNGAQGFWNAQIGEAPSRRVPEAAE